jgi:serine/threonine-protein kinase
VESVTTDPRVGTILQGRYRVLEAIASGGMGSVYRGERVQLGRPVALKFLHAWMAANDQGIKRFEIEARAMSRLSHPNCVAVIDFGTEEGAPFLVMEFVSGITLRKLMEDGPVPIEQALNIGKQLLAGLAHAHGQGIVHRDIKPENILLSEVTGFGVQVRILDFGVAKLRDLATGGLTTGFAVGTPSYMAPEQASSETIDARVDLYAMGVLLFEMIAGRKPFIGDSAVDVIRMHRDDAPPRLRSVAPGVSAALDEVIDKALAKSVTARFQSAGEMAQALAAVPEASARHEVPGALSLPPPPSSVATVAQRAPVPTPAPMPARANAPAPVSAASRKWWIIGGAAAVALLAIGLIVASSGSKTKSEKQAPPDATTSKLAAVAPPDGGASLSLREADLPGIDDIEADLSAGRLREATNALRALSKTHRDSAYIPYLLGQIYMQQNLVEPGLASYREAIRKQPAYRSDATLIKSAIRILVITDERNAYYPIQFLRDDIGAPALPFLEDVKDSKNPMVRQRVASLIDQIEPR